VGVTAASGGTLFQGSNATLYDRLGYGMSADGNWLVVGPATITVQVFDGTVWSVVETFVVTVDPVNDGPTITTIADQPISEDGSTGELSFTVGDVESAAHELTVTAESSDTDLIPPANIVFGGSGPDRTVTITPAANLSGSATITVWVSDGEAWSETSFEVTVTPVNDAPSFTGGDNVSVWNDSENYSAAWATDISAGPEESLDGLSWSVSTDNPGLFAVGPAIDAQGNLTFRPADHAVGLANVTVTLFDNGYPTQSASPVTFTIGVAQPPITVSAVGESRLEHEGEITFTVSLSWKSVGPVSVDWSLVDGSAVRPDDFGHVWQEAWTEDIPVPGYDVTVHEWYDVTIYWNNEYQVQTGEEPAGYWVTSRYDIDEVTVINEVFFSPGATVDPLWINYTVEMQPIYTTIPAGTESSETGPSSAWTAGSYTTLDPCMGPANLSWAFVHRRGRQNRDKERLRVEAAVEVREVSQASGTATSVVR